ncbi:MAG: hypothetical protein RIB98_15860 [Acidimicrobiales bacterium]
METSDIKPSTIMLIAGGAVLLLGTFLDWVSVGEGDFSFGTNAWDTDFFGLLGIVAALIGLVIGGAMAARQFGGMTLPSLPFGFSHEQAHIALSLFAVIITIGFVVRGDVGIGLWLSTLAAIAMLVGSIMEAGAGDSTATPPTQF